MYQACFFEGGEITKKGLLYGIGTYFIWGFLPLFWKQLSEIDALSLLAYRIGWSFIVMTIVCIGTFRWQGIKEQFKSQKKSDWLNLLLAAGSIGLNWGVFIYCVATNQTMQASFAYFCSPLFKIFFGYFLFREKINGWQKIGVLCLVGSMVAKLAGSLSVVALVLSIEGACYGVLEKTGKGHPLFRMWMETIFLLPLVGIIQQRTALPLLSSSLNENCLLILSGVVTALPLVLFMKATRQLPQTVLAVLQYINPLLMLLVSVVCFKEVLQQSDIWSFGWIVIGSILFAIGLRNNYLEEENDKRRNTNDRISNY